MKTFRLLYLVSGLLLLFASGDLAWADRGHSGGQFSGQFSSARPINHVNGNFGGQFHRHAQVGVFIGVPLFDPWFFPPVYAGSPPVVVVPSGDQAYIEQGDAAASPSAYWYRCDNPSGYYPYVKDCPGGWHTEVPTR